MNRPVTVIGIAALLVGLLVGYLWWGSPWSGTRREATEARGRLEEVGRRLAEAEAAQRASEERLKGLAARVGELEGELTQERQRRSRLEVIISEGRK